MGKLGFEPRLSEPRSNVLAIILLPPLWDICKCVYCLHIRTAMSASVTRVMPMLTKMRKKSDRLQRGTEIRTRIVGVKIQSTAIILFPQN